MAPGIMASQAPIAPHLLKMDNNNAPKEIFPDGIRTSGQHDPIYEQLVPFEKFPKHIDGPTVWKKEDYQNNPERWVHRFTAEEIAELEATVDKYIADGTPLEAISQSNFPLPKMSKMLFTLREDLLNGKGFILFKGFPSNEWGLHKTAVGYMGLGTYLGYFVSQNRHGHVLGHVKDLGDDATQIDKTRIYRTNARQYFHADDSDIVGLLCVARSLEGGESDIASAHSVYNYMMEHHTEELKTLADPIWYFDRKGETSKGQQEWIRTSIFYVEPKADGRVYSKWDPYYVRSLKRFSDAGLVPALSEKQEEAMRVLELVCNKMCMHMILEIGDIQFLSNAHVFHARTEYKDYPPPAPRRHLMRLWLATPHSEGGWTLPFHDSDEKKRGGVQVNDTKPHCPIDAE